MVSYTNVLASALSSKKNNYVSYVKSQSTLNMFLSIKRECFNSLIRFSGGEGGGRGLAFLDFCDLFSVLGQNLAIFFVLKM